MFVTVKKNTSNQNLLIQKTHELLNSQISIALTNPSISNWTTIKIVMVIIPPAAKTRKKRTEFLTNSLALILMERNNKNIQKFWKICAVWFNQWLALLKTIFRAFSLRTEWETKKEECVNGKTRKQMTENEAKTLDRVISRLTNENEYREWPNEPETHLRLFSIVEYRCARVIQCKTLMGKSTVLFRQRNTRRWAFWRRRLRVSPGQRSFCGHAELTKNVNRKYSHSVCTCREGL